MKDINKFIKLPSLNENDEIYDEETDYYTKDCGLCNKGNKIYFDDFFDYNEYNYLK